MKTGLLVGAGALIALLGISFVLQGFGVLGACAMSGVTFWAVRGLIIALVGLAIAAASLRRRSTS
jgi:hypothetical protein